MDLKKLKSDAKMAIKGNVGNMVIAYILIFLFMLVIIPLTGFVYTLASSMVAGIAYIFSGAIGLIVMGLLVFAFFYFCAYVYIGIYIGFYNFILNLINGKYARARTVFNYTKDSIRINKVFKIFFKYSIVLSLLGLILMIGINPDSISNYIIPVGLATNLSPFKLMFDLIPNNIINLTYIIPSIFVGIVFLFIGIFIHLPFFITLRKKDIEDETLLSLTKEIGEKYRNDFIKLSFSFLAWIFVLNIPGLIIYTPSILNNLPNYDYFNMVRISYFIMIFVGIYFYCYMNMTYVMFYNNILTEYFGEEYIPEFGINPEALINNKEISYDKLERTSAKEEEETETILDNNKTEEKGENFNDSNNSVN